MRGLTGGLILLAVIGCAAVWFGQPTASQHSWEISLAQQEQRGAQHDMKRARRDAFAAFLEELNQSLVDGSVTLLQARDRLMAYSEAFYPEYLVHVEPMETGASLDLKVAQNLLRCFVAANQAAPNTYDSALIQRLERELKAIEQASHSAEKRYTFR